MRSENEEDLVVGPGEPFVEATRAAEALLRPHLRETPVEASPRLDEITGARTWLKLENLQHTGSFKARGALHKLLSLTPEERARGVVAASTGNHGAAVAWAGQRVDTSVTVFVPRGTSPTKLTAMRRAGAETVVHGTDGIEAELAARREARQSSRVYVSPYNDPVIVVGQATMGVELERQIDDLEVLFVAVGGGGLVSGLAAYLKSLHPDLRIVGCSPEASPVMDESVRRGRIVELPSAPTLSDGTAGGVEPGSITFEPCRELVDEWVRVSEEEIRAAMLEIIDAHHQLIEGSAAVAVAALVKRGRELSRARVGVVICGGNVALETLRSAVAEEVPCD